MKCQVEDCGRDSRARGWCAMHYQRWQVHGTTELPARTSVTITGNFDHGSLQGYNFHKCRCKACVGRYRTYQREWYREHKDKFHSYDRKHQLKRYYGLSLEDYERMLQAQGGVCAVCKGLQQDPRKRYLCVDHCHKTGAVRGLLCDHCNRAASNVRDDPSIAVALAEYLTVTALRSVV